MGKEADELKKKYEEEVRDWEKEKCKRCCLMIVFVLYFQNNRIHSYMYYASLRITRHKLEEKEKQLCNG